MPQLEQVHWCLNMLDKLQLICRAVGYNLLLLRNPRLIGEMYFSLFFKFITLKDKPGVLIPHFRFCDWLSRYCIRLYHFPVIIPGICKDVFVKTV